MKQMTTAFLLTTTLVFVGCASSTVKMTPQETQVFLNKTPQVAKLLSEKSGKSMVRQSDYCESTLGRSCWKVECLGSAKNLSETECWKTPYEAFGISATSSASEQTTEQLLASCQATHEDSAKRRSSCFDYFSRLQSNTSEKADVANTQKLIKQFCDMKDVTCSRQYIKFGKGDLNTDGMRSSSYKRGVYQVSSKEKPENNETYEFTILK